MTARDKYCVYRRGEADLTLFASLSVAVFAVALLPIEFEKVDKIPQGFPRLLNLRRPGAIIVVFLDDLLVKLSLVPANRQDTPVGFLEVGSEFVEPARRRMRAQPKYP